ncbi:MAG: hypothetical protein HOO90_08200 [Methylotenera sp.]|uniref:hypothetical protein n=1 Tax=Methylotenera sp. TaxID=2051956 RepID=UPI00179B1BA4|nr:hypothetical protein [Methylotenera sp.]NOU25504.1 hypothetical protein [Methylotenera sp.]
MAQTLEEARDGVCRVLSEIASRPELSEASIGLAGAGLISTVAKYWDELPPAYLREMLPSLAILSRELVVVGMATNELMGRIKDGE